MSRAWTCTARPDRHGSFLQSGLDALALICAWMSGNRYRCPVCAADGEPGYVRPASSTEAANLVANQGE